MDDQDRDNMKHHITRQTLLHPPPNHNPLIGLLQTDTLINVHDSLTTLQELTINSDLCLCPASNNGLYFLMDCIIDALRFEIKYRDKLNQ